MSIHITGGQIPFVVVLGQSAQLSPTHVHAIVNMLLQEMRANAPPEQVAVTIAAPQPVRPTLISRTIDVIVVDPGLQDQGLEGEVLLLQGMNKNSGPASQKIPLQLFVVVSVSVAIQTKNMSSAQKEEGKDPAKGLRYSPPPAMGQIHPPQKGNAVVLSKEGEGTLLSPSPSLPLQHMLQKISQENPEFAAQLAFFVQEIEKQCMSEGKGLLKSGEAVQVVIQEEVKGFDDMSFQAQISLVQSLASEHPQLALHLGQNILDRLVQEGREGQKEMKEFIQTLEKQHPLLALEGIKQMQGEEKAVQLKEFMQRSLPSHPEVFVQATRLLSPQQASSQLKDAIATFQDAHPHLAFEAAKALLGEEGRDALMHLALHSIEKGEMAQALECLQALRGKEHLERYASLVKPLLHTHPEAALQIANLILDKAKLIADSQVRQMILAWISPPLQIKEISLAANPFAQVFPFRPQGSTAPPSSEEVQDEGEEEESEGSFSAFTFYINAPLEGDLLQVIQKKLLQAGVCLKVKEMQNYGRIEEAFSEEKKDAVFFQRKILIASPFSPWIDLYLDPFGLYSEKARSLEDLMARKTCVVCIPQEAFERDRALALLAEAQIKERCSLQEVPCYCLAEYLEKADAVVLPSQDAWFLGELSRPLAIEDIRSPYVYSIAMRKRKGKKRPLLSFIKKLLYSETMHSYIKVQYQGVIIPTFEAEGL